MSVSVEVFLLPVARLNKPEIEEDDVALDCTEGARVEFLRCGAFFKKRVRGRRKMRPKTDTHSQVVEVDLDRQWELRGFPEVLSSFPVARTGSGEAVDIRRR